MDTSDWTAALIIFVLLVLLICSRMSERDVVEHEPEPIDRNRMRRTDPVWKDRGTL